MIVYSDRSQIICVRGELARLRDSLALTDHTEALIRFGQIESGIVDELCPDIDEESDITRALREFSVNPTPDGVSSLLRLDLPERIEINSPEGFAYYAVYPQMYADAARRWVRDMGPARCIVIGIRSIGASLSSVIVAELRSLSCGADSLTVRPHGHPFNRELSISPALQDRIRNATGVHFLIVDEGPGLSGSSFISVAAELNRLGVQDEFITLFPSWETDGSGLLSDAARQRWRHYRQYVSRFEDVCLRELSQLPLKDISGGLWRRELYGNLNDCPAVQPQHERRKYLDESKRHIWKFAGLAHFGRQKLERANQLKQFTPRVSCFSQGFLVSEWLAGKPLMAADVTPQLLDSMAGYLSHLRNTFSRDQHPDFEAILRMMQVNTGCSLDILRRDRTLIEDAPLVQIDGRMLPHEWLITDEGYKKTDALDHHDDHFFPGDQDIAWDLAGAAIEFHIDSDVLVDRYLTQQHDSTLRRRLPFYTMAYLSYRYGYCVMAEQSLGQSPDGRRFTELRAYYARELARRSVVPNSSQA